MGFLAIFVIFSLYLAGVEGLYKSGGPVTLLTKRNFANVVIGSELPVIVEFFAPWCGHCKQLAPIYTEAAKKLSGLVDVAAIDCDQERDLCGMFEVKGFPTIKVFGGGDERTKKKVDPKREPVPWKEPQDYNGARSAAAIAAAGLAKLHDKAIRVFPKGEQLAKALPADGGKAVVLFSKKEEASSLYKALSITYSALGLPFFLVPEKGNADVAKGYGVTKFPTLLVVNGDEEGKPSVYSGEFKADLLHAWISKYAPAPKKQAGGSSSEEEEPTPKPVEYDQKLEEITSQAQWEGKCTSKTGLCGVAFLDPEEDSERQKRFIGVLEEVLKKVYKNVRIMWVDGPKHYKFFEKFSLGGGFPNFAIYTPSKKRIVPFKGGFSIEDLTEWVDRVLLGKSQSTEVKDLVFE